ncbi:MAG: competence/damage-inducible protein A [Acidimicrobiia bacterium]
MRCEVLAVGTELILGDITDTNSSWIGQQLAAAGIDSYLHVAVGDNRGRMVDALRGLLAQSDAVIVCGGIGPTPDDITREVVAEVMGTELVRSDELVEEIRALFARWGRTMSPSNERQGDVPRGATPIRNHRGTAPGLICPIGSAKVVYVVPGVPYEMMAMVADVVVPDLLERAGERAAIVSRNLRTWGTSESTLAEMIGERVDAQTNPTIAFLARGIEGLYVRITAKAPTTEEAAKLIEPEEASLRAILGHLVFGVDDDSMEEVVLGLLRQQGRTLGVAESLTGGLVGSRLASVAGASDVFRGSVVSYATEVKRSVLGVTAGKVVSGECAAQMAEGARRVLGADVGLGVTGVAGPAGMDGEQPGTVWFAVATGDGPAEAVHGRLPGDRNLLRQFATISLLNLLRLRLLDLEGSGML